MKLVADRFAIRNGAAVDLATGEAVVLVCADAGDSVEQARWTARCGALQRVQHHGVARLVDYGGVGRARRFEAWRCGGPWTGAVQAAQVMWERAAAFLRGCGLSTGRISLNDLRAYRGRPVLLPPRAAGYEVEDGAAVAVCAVDALGWTSIDRPACHGILELFELPGTGRPAVVRLWGPPGAGKTYAVAHLAQAARLRGVVPVAARQLTGDVLDAVRGRTVLVVDDHPDDGRACWAALLRATLGSPRTHIVLSTAQEESADMSAVRLEAIPVGVLAASVRPASIDTALKCRVERAASGSRGLPGRFAGLLWGWDMAVDISPGHAQPCVRAAERASVYGEEAPPIHEARTPGHRVWLAPGELATLRRQAAEAAGLVDRGRFAPGTRQLRQALGRLVRRSDWVYAGVAALALARALRTRGWGRDALALLAHAQEYASRTGNEAALVDVGIESGYAWLELGRLDEAESVLGATVEVARRTGDRERTAAASVGLARCSSGGGVLRIKRPPCRTVAGCRSPSSPRRPSNARSRRLGAATIRTRWPRPTRPRSAPPRADTRF